MWIHLGFYPLCMYHNERRVQLLKKKIKKIAMYEITGYAINGLNVQLLPAVFRENKKTAWPF